MNKKSIYGFFFFISQSVFASISPTIDSMSLDDYPVLGSSVNINYKTTPSVSVITNYATCVTDEVENCTLTSSYLVADTIYDDGNPLIPVSIPSDLGVLNKYFTYCLEISDKNSSPMKCRSELIISESIKKQDKSYINQSVDFTMYEKDEPITPSSLFVTSNSAFLMVNGMGNAFVYGSGNESLLPPFQTNIEGVYSLLDGFGVLHKNKTLTLWGDYFSGSVNVSDVSRVFPSVYSVSVLKENGKIEVYGDSNKGAFISENVRKELEFLLALGGIVTDIYYSSQAYLATILMPTGEHRLIAWGNVNYGGDLPDDLLNKSLNIRYVVSTSNSFAVLTNEGDVFTWGPYSQLQTYTNIKEIKATRYAFAAITSEGNVVTWGERGYGGDLSLSASAFTQENPISRLCATDAAFIAIADGFKGLAAWGSEEKGGYIPKSLQDTLDHTEMSPSFQCASTEGAFALYDLDNLLVWGSVNSGGILPENVPKFGTITITSNNHAFLALSQDGLFAWGNEKSGGCIPNARECTSDDDPSLNLEQDITSLNLNELHLGSFLDYSDSENKVTGSFYISDSNKALVWGGGIIDANVSW